MPLPFILGAAAVIAGATGVGSGIAGAVKMKEAKNTQEIAQRRHKKNLDEFSENNQRTTTQLDKLGELEINIQSSFGKFSNLIEKIHNRPEFSEYKKDGIKIPKIDKAEIDEVSVNAHIVAGSIGGLSAGVIGGLAASGGITSAVMSLGVASTGTAISTLSGAAATNATLAALGGGSIAAGGGGMALGSTILGGATLGVGFLVGGAILGITGHKLSEKADEAYNEMLRAEEEINKVNEYLKELYDASLKYTLCLEKVKSKYDYYLKKLDRVVVINKKTNYNYFNKEDKVILENTCNLVAILHKMCKLKLIKNPKNENELPIVRQNIIFIQINESSKFLDNLD